MIDMSEVSTDELMIFVKKIEKLENERSAISDDIKQAYNIAKDKGFVVDALRAVIRLYKQNSKNRVEFVGALDKYWAALGEKKADNN